MKIFIGVTLGILGGVGMTVWVAIGIVVTSGDEIFLVLGPYFVIGTAIVAWTGAIVGFRLLRRLFA